MKILSLFFVLLCLIAVGLFSIATASTQHLPETTRLLRFPTTNGTQIGFYYAGELYTVGKEGGTARRLTSGPGYTSFVRFSPDETEIALPSQYAGNTQDNFMTGVGATQQR